MADPIPLHSLLSDMRGGIDAALAASRTDRSAGDALDAAWPAIRDTVGDDLDKALDADLIGLLAGGWSKAAELRGYTDAKKYPPGKTVAMTLAKTSSTISIDPELTLVVGEALRHKLPLTVEFIATLNAAVLTIAGGRITALRLGKVALDAKLKWDKHAVPLGLKQRELDLPGTFKFDPGVAIPRGAPKTPKA
jgi:hypothetical protein